MSGNNHPPSILSSVRGSFALVAAVFLATCGILIHARYGQFWVDASGNAVGCDDAYISFRYAHNLFVGNGLVFNPGDRVEGYSNLLWTVMLVPAFSGGKEFVYPFAVALNCALFGLALILFWRFCVRRLNPFIAHLATLVLALSPWVWVNAGTGLESVLVLVAFLGIWICVEAYCEDPSPRKLVLLVAFCLLSTYSRVDGFFVPGLAAIYLFWKRHYRAGLFLALCVSLALGLHTAFRILYYHDVMANTYYNKVSGNVWYRGWKGLGFVCKYGLRTGVAFAIGAMAVMAVMRFWVPEQKERAKTGFALPLVVGWVLFLISIGGDIYYERFMIAILPAAIFVIFAACQRLRSMWTFAIGAALATVPFVFVGIDGRFAYQTHKYDGWVTLGKYLGANYPGKVLAIDAAGKVPYFSGLFTIDMLGLNDTHIAKMKPRFRGPLGHSKYDADYVLGREPDLIAAWIDTQMNMAWGLSRQRYAHDYTLKYVVNLSRFDTDSNIIDVTSMTDANTMALIEEMALSRNVRAYGVLLRKDRTPSP